MLFAAWPCKNFPLEGIWKAENWKTENYFNTFIARLSMVRLHDHLDTSSVFIGTSDHIQNDVIERTAHVSNRR
jgi:hypothetical protein